MESNNQWWSVLNCENIFAKPIKKSKGRDISLFKEDTFYIPSSNSNDISSPLSPITNFLLNDWVKAIEKNRNIILTFPNTLLKPTPLLAYIYSFLTKKSTLIFTSGNINSDNDPISIHNRNFYSLYAHEKFYNSTISKFLYENIFMGYIGRNNSLQSKIHWPYADKKYKKEHRERIESKLDSDEYPKIILNGSDSLTNILTTINRIYIDGKEVEGVSNDFAHLDVGCLIFENADKYINSKMKSKNLVEWLDENVGKDIMTFFHFSNSNLNFMSLLKDATNSLVIPFDRTILKNNKELYRNSLHYFKNKSSYELQILNRYNLDEEYNYTSELNINIFENTLNQGNLDKFWKLCIGVLHDIDVSRLKNPSLFYRGINLLWSLNNLAINPSDLKFRMKIDNIWFYQSVNDFLSIYLSKLNEEDSSNQSLYWFIVYLSSFYKELSKCRRYGESHSYKRVGKDYELLDILNNKDDYFNDDKPVIVGTYFNTEVNILKQQILDLKNIDVIHMDNLTKANYDYKNYNLILPGVIPLKYFPLLMLPFNNVNFLAYNGLNELKIKKQIDLINDLSMESEKFAMDYFKEVFDFAGKSEGKFFEDFNERYEEFLRTKNDEDTKEVHNKSENFIEDSDEKVDKSDDSIEDSFATDAIQYSIESSEEGETDMEFLFEEEVLEKNLSVKKKITSFREFIKIRTDYSNLYEENVSLDEEYGEYHPGNSRGYMASELVSVKLLNTYSNKILIKKLPKNRKYLKFTSFDKLDDCLEVKPELLKEGEYVIILDDHKSFLDTFIDIFGFDEDINRDLAYSWKDKILSYVKKNSLTTTDFHKQYKAKGGKRGSQTVYTWLYGNAIAPIKANDIKVLGEAIGDDFLINHYNLINVEAKKIRSLNMTMGRKLRSIVKGIIVEKELIDFQSLSFEERIMYQRIKDSIYMVQEDVSS